MAPACRATSSPPLNKHHGRNCRDPKFSRQSGRLFGVDLGHNPSTRAFRSYFAYFRRYHFARTAPGRPKINQDWKRRASYQRVEALLVCYVDRLVRQLQLVMTLSATKSLSELSVYHSITLTTFWTGYQQPAMINIYRVHEKSSATILPYNLEANDWCSI
jgi:hypothetical protein